MDNPIVTDKYTLYLGDCLEIMKLMENKSVDAVITDPPYDFKGSQIANYQKEFERIVREWIVVFSPPENTWFFTWDLPTQWLFWIKPISTKNTSKSYSRFVETILVTGKGTWNPERHWSQYTNVFTDLVDSKVHPYAKPLSMMMRLIQNHTNPGSVVFDSFMGSGTTGVACMQLNRRFIGVEIDPNYFQIAKKRIEDAAMQMT